MYYSVLFHAQLWAQANALRVSAGVLGGVRAGSCGRLVSHVPLVQVSYGNLGALRLRSVVYHR